MPKAVIKNGAIYPIDPLPPDWRDGTELLVEKAPTSPDNEEINNTDKWMDRVEAMASLINPADDDHLMAAVAAIREKDREIARRKAGLGE